MIHCKFIWIADESHLGDVDLPALPVVGDTLEISVEGEGVQCWQVQDCVSRLQAIREGDRITLVNQEVVYIVWVDLIESLLEEEDSDRLALNEPDIFEAARRVLRNL